MKEKRKRIINGYDIASRWFVGVVIVFLILLLISLFVDGCVTQRVEINLDSPDSSQTDVGPKLEINSEE